MENLRESSTSTYLYAPLVISLMGIIASAIALLIYQLILPKYCLESRNTQTLISPTIQQTHLPIGVDNKILKKIPIISYNLIHTKGKLFHVDENECAVCLGELEDQDLVRSLPICRHTFHVACIDKWFVAHSNCPVCRAPITEIEIYAMYLLDLISNMNLNDENTSSTSTSSSKIQPRDMLRHDVSIVMSKEKRSTKLSSQIRRSLSMGYTYDNHEGDHSSLSSKSSKLLSSLSLIGRGKGKQVIPY